MSGLQNDITTEKSPQDWKKRLIRFGKWVVITLVVAGISYAGWKVYHELQQEGFDYRKIEPIWLAIAMLFYFGAMLNAWFYWRIVLIEMGQRPPVWQSIVAFFLGQLGKYVPGKGMVVVIRTGLIKGENVNAAVAALSVFVETLTMMAVGGFVAAVILISIASDHIGLVVLAVGLMLCSGIPTLPPLFRRIVRMLKLTKISPEVDSAIDRLSYKLILKGWIISLGTWALMGMSLYAVLESTPGSSLSVHDIPNSIGCTSLANVAGFLSLIPGGLGVRELVLTPLMEPNFGLVRAAIATLLLRLVWLATELLLSIILYGVRERRTTR